MTVTTWAIAALCAGILGWIGPSVIARLPESRDAGPDTPSYRAIADVGHLSHWLAAVAVALVTLVSLAAPWYLLPAWVVLCGVGTWLAYVDARTKLLPTRLVGPLYAATLLVVLAEAAFTDDWRMLLWAVVASLVAYAVFWLVWWVSTLGRAGAFGFGDVRFAAPLGLVLGSLGGWAAPVGLYLGILLGGVAGLVLKARGRQDAFALGPWLLAGTVLGPLVISRY